MGEFWKRLIFGALFVVILLGSIILGRMSVWVMVFATAIIVWMSSEEIANLFPHKPDKLLKNIVLSSVMILYFFLVLFSMISDSMMENLFMAPIFFNIPLFIALFSKKHDYVSVIGASWLAMMFVAMPCGIMLMFYNEEVIGVENGWVLLIYTFILIWVNDIFAYLTGSAIGRHKLFERISPKKTIEGSVGGAVFTMLFAYFINRFVLNVFFFDGFMNDIQSLFLALIIVVFGTLGDLTESMIKRHAGVKDSGNLIPGHGGMLDRFDATFMAMPFAFIYLMLI